MKPIHLFFVFLPISLLLTACGGSSADANRAPKDLADAKTMLSEKQNHLKELQGQIAELEAFIAKNDTTQRKEKRVLVTTQAVSLEMFEHFVEVQGNVTTQEDPAFASSETGGRIVELLVKEGDMVKKGDLIAKVDFESVRKSIEELDKPLELARDMLKRQESLWKQNIGSEIQYVQAKNQVETLEKTKERMEFELRKANVFAPASGFVDMVMVKSGEMAGPGTPIIQILNTSALKVVSSVPEVYLSAVRRGDKIRMMFPALGEEQMGTITTIGRTINPNNRTFEIEATADSRGGMLKPNLLATVFVRDYMKEKAIVVPSELIMQDVKGNSYVMVKEGEKAIRKNITTGRSYQNRIVIESGLDGSETLLVKGARQVVEGDLLTVVTE